MNHLVLKTLLFGTILIGTHSSTMATSPTRGDCGGSCQPSVGQTCEQKSYYQEFLTILDTMKKEMLSTQPTGNVTQDFLAEMIPHHQAAIAMSENILKYTKNPEIIDLATSIIKEQTAGIKQMQLLQKTLHSTPPACDSTETEYLKKYLAIYNIMTKKMATAKSSCNPDVDFLSEMIPHHEGAIAMAKNILKYSQNDEMKRIAQTIIKTQKPQAKKLQKLLDTLEKS